MLGPPESIKNSQKFLSDSIFPVSCIQEIALSFDSTNNCTGVNTVCLRCNAVFKKTNSNIRERPEKEKKKATTDQTPLKITS